MRPLRPFPLALGVGTDICNVARIHNILRSPRRGRFVQRILAPEELAAAAAAAAAGGLPELTTAEGRCAAGDGDGESVRSTGMWKEAVFVAGRFAAKEAAMKAHEHRRLGWHDIVIERRRDGGGSGPPVARIKADEAGLDDESALVSISHDGDYATAVCIAYYAGRTAGRIQTSIEVGK